MDAQEPRGEQRRACAAQPVAPCAVYMISVIDAGWPTLRGPPFRSYRTRENPGVQQGSKVAVTVARNVPISSLFSHHL